MTATLALAEQEALRYFRRRETFWMFLLLGVLFGAPAVVLAVAAQTRWELRPDGGELASIEGVRNIFRVLEVLPLLFVAYGLSFRSVRQEIDGGSFALLRQTPISSRGLLLGKALGVAAVCLVVHSYCAAFLVLYTPFLRESHASVVAPFVFIALLAWGAIPEGMFYGLASSGGRTVAPAIKGLAVVRWAAPLLLAQLLLHRDPGESLGNVFDAVAAWANDLMTRTSPPVSGRFVHPLAAPVALMLWWLFSGWLLWRACVARSAR